MTFEKRVRVGHSRFRRGITPAFCHASMTMFCIGFALLAAGIFTEMIASSSAPFGYQDETGFHFGHENAAPTAFELENSR